ncbi:hypothetical protein EON68_03380, partial [archaeon]
MCAGVSPEKVVEAHGSFASATCLTCMKHYSFEWLQEQVLAPPQPEETDGVHVPTCELCGGIVKPDITFFGEALPPRFGRLAPSDTRAADCLIVIGTSLKVYPVAGLVDEVSADVPRVLINREPVGIAPDAIDMAGERVEVTPEEAAAAAHKAKTAKAALKAARAARRRQGRASSQPAALRGAREHKGSDSEGEAEEERRGASD